MDIRILISTACFAALNLALIVFAANLGRVKRISYWTCWRKPNSTMWLDGN